MPPLRITLAKPQSTTCTSPKLPIMTLLGLRSRWITPRACAYATVRQTSRKTVEQRAAVASLGPALGQAGGQRLALHELHREERAARRYAASELVDGHDAGMLELPADLRFFDEALHEIGALREVLVEQHLERHVAAEVVVAAAVHDADAATSELADDLVARSEASSSALRALRGFTRGARWPSFVHRGGGGRS